MIAIASSLRRSTRVSQTWVYGYPIDYCRWQGALVLYRWRLR
jgi:hypothetical protein